MILRHVTPLLHVGRMAGWKKLWSPADHDLAPPQSIFLPFHPTSAPVRMLFFGRRKSSGICPRPTYIHLHSFTAMESKASCFMPSESVQIQVLELLPLSELVISFSSRAV